MASNSSGDVLQANETCVSHFDYLQLQRMRFLRPSRKLCPRYVLRPPVRRSALLLEGSVLDGYRGYALNRRLTKRF